MILIAGYSSLQCEGILLVLNKVFTLLLNVEFQQRKMTNMPAINMPSLFVNWPTQKESIKTKKNHSRLIENELKQLLYVQARCTLEITVNIVTTFRYCQPPITFS